MGLVLLTIGSYLLGSVPAGFLVGKARGVDLREHGSKNIGATNAGRVLGRRFAILVFCFDCMKGFVPVFVGERLAPDLSLAPATAGLLAGLAAIAGHVFPVYLKFRGGKGVATAAGAFIGLDPLAAAAALMTWVVVLLISRMVALASVLAAWAFPAAVLATQEELAGDRTLVLAASVMVGILITLRHSSNIGRILRGEEPRISLARKSGGA